MSGIEERARDYAATNGGAVPASGAVGVDTDSVTYTTWGYLLSGGPDINPLLSGRNRFFIYEEMRRSDPAVKSLLLTFKLPLRAAQWSVEPAGGGKDPEDRVIAEAVERQHGLGDRDARLDLTWDEQLEQKLLMLDWGCMFEELVWGEIESWTFDDGSTRDVRPLTRLAPRAPHSIFRIAPDHETGGIAWIEQQFQRAMQIPGDKLAWNVFDREGANFWGTSLLRSVFGPWRLKKALMISAGIGWDRFAAGIPEVRYPMNAGQDAERRAKEIGRNVRTHERAYVVLEGTEQDGWNFRIENAGNSLPDPVPLLRHFDAQIAMAGLQQFTSLGRTETGSRAVGEVQSEPFYMAAQALAGQLADQTTKQVVRRFVDVNFGPDREVPRIAVGKIQGKSVETIAAALANLGSIPGFDRSLSNVELQNAVLEIMELPTLPTDASAAPVQEGAGLGA